MHLCDVILSRSFSELGAFELKVVWLGAFVFIVIWLGVVYAVYLCIEDCGSEGASLGRVSFHKMGRILAVRGRLC